MHVDARTLPDGSVAEGDVCIIGAGAAGITMARTLAGQGLRVLLLESGGFNYDADTQALYEGESVGRPYFPLQSARLRFFGGTTGHWGGWCAPFDPIDFEHRDWIPYSGWPISRKDLDPYYAQAQDICQLGPYRYDPSYWEDEAEERMRLPLDETRVSTKILQFSPPTRFGTVYRDDVVNAPDIHLWTFANVTNIETTENASEVTRLQVRCLNGKQHEARARFYVLACGGMENPRMLLLSNKTEPKGLGNRHDLVGRFFMEHPHVVSAYMLLGDTRPMDYYRFTFGGPPMGLFGIPEPLQQERQILNYSAVLLERAMNETEQHEMGFTEDVSTLIQRMNTRKAAAQRKGEPAPASSTGMGFALSTRIEQAPNPDSRVTLSPEKDALGLNRVQLDWRLTELDKRTIRISNEIIAHAVGASNIGRVRLLDWLTEDDHSWPDFLVGGWHHMGTTRMSPDPKTGVVDADCKVHGINNLYVAGSSVYPTSGTANPTLTLIALALRMSDHLKGRLRS